MTKVKAKSGPLEYQVNLCFNPRDELYVARVPELENCHSHGKNPEEALRNAKEAIELWLETAKALGIAIPEPIFKKKFSGKFVVRTPEDLHSHLAREALRRGKSMNELAVEFLRKGLRKTG
jgi:antitoxin HicB